ncbi:MAG: glycosyltransferase family 4 protein [Salinisphaera sp.]|jgi:glycosyltransferase involved in cell wall biosynthesis|nr:glycosyltransferase family 4 protein [Salinisphaera sp.]
MVASARDSRQFTIAHYVSLSGFGGVEQQFAAFVERASRRVDLRQAVVVASSTIHPHHQAILDLAEAGIHDEKRVAGFKLGHRPKILRQARYRWIARRVAPDVALLWNRLGQQARVLDALGPRRCLYWEHGSAWLAGEQQSKAATLARLPAVICNSVAARRMLEIHWQYQGSIRVCLNGMRAGVDRQRARCLPVDRPLRLGTVSRLVPIKATVLALHALAVLIELGANVTLAIAGDGPLRKELMQWSTHLGIDEQVRFHGVVKDMPAFYNDIDLLLHPALREPFGVAAAEAMAAGCPVICSAVDGLPEVVVHGETGLCVPATGDLARYRELGGHTDGLPPVVYDPLTDTVRPPQICEPAALADAVITMQNEPSRYERMSTAGIARVAERFDFEQHVDAVLSAAREYAATGTLT